MAKGEGGRLIEYVEKTKDLNVSNTFAQIERFICELGHGCGTRRLAKSNAEQVRKIRSILEELSLGIATPAEARGMLRLKGGDQVGF